MPKKSDEREITPEEAERLLAWLHQVVQRLGSRAEAARVAGISPQQFGRLLYGTSQNPSAITLARLSKASGVHLDALVAAPQKELRVSVDGELLGRILGVIRRVYREANVTLSDVDLGRIAAEEHNAAAGSTPDEWPTVLRLVEARHRERLATDTARRRTRQGA
ncbi:MAG: helix-turn-helix transcriptional regulator [Polyangiaceae bacterium]|nr:helix-turn-helix transcriptional regulator [Polyangiaceae bacterium]